MRVIFVQCHPQVVKIIGSRHYFELHLMNFAMGHPTAKSDLVFIPGPKLGKQVTRLSFQLTLSSVGLIEFLSQSHDISLFTLNCASFGLIVPC